MKTAIVVLITVISTGCYYYRPEQHEKQVAHHLVDIGVERLRLGDLKEADHAFELAYEVAQLPEAFNGIGAVAFLERNFSKAEENFKKAYKIAPNSSAALGNLALLYEQRGQFSRAKELYIQALTADPTNFKIRGNFAAFLADYSVDESDRDRAAEEVSKASLLLKHPLIERNKSLILRK